MSTKTTTLFGGGTIHNQPTLWVQDLKGANTGSGYVDAANTLYSRDINYIGKNTISGASLTNSGSTATVIGFVGPQGIVNNNSGIHINATYITLPKGDYYFESHVFDTVNSAGSYKIYNRTNSTDVFFKRQQYNSSNGSVPYDLQIGYFTLGSTSDLDIRIMYVSISAQAHAMGGLNLPVGTIKDHRLDWKIYKLS